MAEALCALVAGKLMVLAVTSFTLSWTHSVEKTEWWESWRVEPEGLQLVEARLQGAGAGMEPPDGAVATSGGWSYRPDLGRIPRLVLAASGTTTSGWQLCTELGCDELAVQGGPPIELWPSDGGLCR